MIRQLKKSDVDKYINLLYQLDDETDQMMLMPDERTTSTDDVLSMIKDHIHHIWAAESKDEFVGYITAVRGNYIKNRHTAYVVIGILEDYRNQGIGKKLFAEVEKWATNNGVLRLELTVICDNKPAVSLYRKVGFEIEGTRKNALFNLNGYVDEYFMSKILGNGNFI